MAIDPGASHIIAESRHSVFCLVPHEEFTMEVD